MAVTQGRSGFVPNFTWSSKIPKYNFSSWKNKNTLIDYGVIQQNTGLFHWTFSSLSNMVCSHKDNAWWWLYAAPERKSRFPWIKWCVTPDTDWKNKFRISKNIKLCSGTSSSVGFRGLRTNPLLLRLSCPLSAHFLFDELQEHKCDRYFT